MSILAVDLAAVAWAAYLGDGGRSANTANGEEYKPEPPQRWSCLDFPSETEAVYSIADYFEPIYGDKIPEVLIVEDLPHGLNNASLIKDVSRMQGRIVQRMVEHKALDRVLFVQPNTWQSALGVNRKTPQETEEVALALGFEPPTDLLTRYEYLYRDLKGSERQKIRERCKKVRSDYVDAFLIYAFAVKLKAAGELWLPNKAIQRYTR